MEFLGLASRIFLSVVFLCSGVGKFIWPPPDNLALLEAAEIRIPVPIRRVVWLLPYLEIALAVCLTIGSWSPVVSLGTSALLIFMTIVLWRAKKRGFSGGCSCFGYRRNAQITIENVLFNGQLIVASVFLFLNKTSTTTQPIWWVTANEIAIASFAVVPFLATHIVVGEISRLRAVLK